MAAVKEKYAALEKRLKKLGRAAVAFSGGVDSSFLAYAAKNALGGDAFAITIWSPLLSAKDRSGIFDFAERYGIQLIRIPLDEAADPLFRANRPERCYVCKSMRIKKLEECAREWRIPWVLDGSNSDDLNDYRPGMRALDESEVTLSPLLECGFSKDDIRIMSAELGLPTASKPAAACLASRVPTGTEITEELLYRIECGEEILRKYLPENAQIRLRYDGTTAKIETDTGFIPAISFKFHMISEELASIGICGAVIDKDGYRMGGVTLQPD